MRFPKTGIHYEFPGISEIPEKRHPCTTVLNLGGNGPLLTNATPQVLGSMVRSFLSLEVVAKRLPSRFQEMEKTVSVWQSMMLTGSACSTFHTMHCRPQQRRTHVTRLRKHSHSSCAPDRVLNLRSLDLESGALPIDRPILGLTCQSNNALSQSVSLLI